MASLTQEQVAESIDGMTVLELSEFIKKFEARYGVTAAAPAAAAAAAPVAAAAVAVVEEQTEFTAVLTEIGPDKIPVIKVVRELTGLGLKEAEGSAATLPPRRSRRPSARKRPTRSRPLSRSRAPRSSSSSRRPAAAGLPPRRSICRGVWSPVREPGRLPPPGCLPGPSRKGRAFSCRWSRSLNAATYRLSSTIRPRNGRRPCRPRRGRWRSRDAWPTLSRAP